MDTGGQHPLPRQLPRHFRSDGDPPRPFSEAQMKVLKAHMTDPATWASARPMRPQQPFLTVKGLPWAHLDPNTPLDEQARQLRQPPNKYHAGNDSNACGPLVPQHSPSGGSGGASPTAGPGASSPPVDLQQALLDSINARLAACDTDSCNSGSPRGTLLQLPLTHGSPRALPLSLGGSGASHTLLAPPGGGVSGAPLEHPLTRRVGPLSLTPAPLSGSVFSAGGPPTAQEAPDQLLAPKSASSDGKGPSCHASSNHGSSRCDSPHSSSSSLTGSELAALWNNPGPAAPSRPFDWKNPNLNIKLAKLLDFSGASSLCSSTSNPGSPGPQHAAQANSPAGSSSSSSREGAFLRPDPYVIPLALMTYTPCHSIASLTPVCSVPGSPYSCSGSQGGEDSLQQLREEVRADVSLAAAAATAAAAVPWRDAAEKREAAFVRMYGLQFPHGIDLSKAHGTDELQDLRQSIARLREDELNKFLARDERARASVYAGLYKTATNNLTYDTEDDDPLPGACNPNQQDDKRTGMRSRLDKAAVAEAGAFGSACSSAFWTIGRAAGSGTGKGIAGVLVGILLALMLAQLGVLPVGHAATAGGPGRDTLGTRGAGVGAHISSFKVTVGAGMHSLQQHLHNPSWPAGMCRSSFTAAGQRMAAIAAAASSGVSHASTQAAAFLQHVSAYVCEHLQHLQHLQRLPVSSFLQQATPAASSCVATAATASMQQGYQLWRSTKQAAKAAGLADFCAQQVAAAQPATQAEKAAVQPAAQAVKAAVQPKAKAMLAAAQRTARGMMAALKPATQAVAAAAQGAARAVHAATPRLRPAQLLAQFLVLFAGQQRQVAHSNPMLPLLHITPAQPTAAAVMCPQQAPSTSWRTLVQGVQQAEAAASMVCAYSSATALKQLLQQVANAEAAASRITAHDPRAALASLLQQVAAAEAAVNSVCKHDPHAHLHRLLQQVAESGSTGAGTASGPTPGTACVVCNLGNIGKLAVALALRAALMQHMHSSF